MQLPTGTVTFLFTDIEGSTQLWEHYTDTMPAALARHDALLRGIIEAHGGSVFKTVGDAFCAAFRTADAALAAALQAQRALNLEPWPETGPLRVRMGLHTGAAEERDSDYFGPAVNRVARLLSIGHGQQVLLSQATRSLVDPLLPAGAALRCLGVHHLKDLNAPETIWQLLHNDLPAEFPPLRSLDPLRNNLGQQLGSFIGREAELRAVNDYLAQVRLLTLTGAGGVGKTRLAIQAAAEVNERYADGVWMAEFAALAEPDLVPQAVAGALSIREEPGRAVTETICDFLRTKQLVLLLDNCEHLLAACAALAHTILRRCTQVRILATSREPLGLTGERIYRVPSLALPDPQASNDPARLLDFDACRLFVDRAALHRPDVGSREREAAAVAQICRQLDGIPLALELAAARVRVMPVEQIAHRLKDRYRLLTGGSRSALPRQQTLRALMDWSYDLLSAEERSLFRRLSVFAGGWSLEMAEAICAGGDIEEGLVLDLHTSLVDKSLVAYEEQAGVSRYALLETLRQYAGDRLQEAHETDEFRLRHRDHMIAMAQTAYRHLVGGEQAFWLTRLERERGNLRAALECCAEQCRAAALSPEYQREPAEQWLGLVDALMMFWFIRGPLAEGRDQAERALSVVHLASDRVAANAYNAAGVLCGAAGAEEAALEYHRRSLEIATQSGLTQGIARSLNNLAIIAERRADYFQMRRYLNECLKIYEELNEPAKCAMALVNLGAAASRQEDYDAAEAYYLRSLETLHGLQYSSVVSIALHNLGVVMLHRDRLDRAADYLRQAVALRTELGDRIGLILALERFAGLAVRRGRFRDAARWLAVADAARNAEGIVREVGHADDFAQDCTAARAELGEPLWAQLWEEGGKVGLEEGIAEAIRG